LEVSSPGLDRKLVKESDYARFDGKLARIQTRIPLHNQRVFRGTLRGFQNGKVHLEMAQGKFLEIPLDVIHEARLEFDWAAEKARSKSAATRPEE
jgi:ribosome maturation factor RimP